MKPSARPSRRGFTLMELMIVLVVIGILSALIVPELRGTYGDAVLRSGSRELVDLCSLASARAVSFQRAHRVRLDPATGRFQLEKQGRTADGSPGFLPVRDIPGTHGQLDPRLTAHIEPSTPDPSARSDQSDQSDRSDRSDPSSPSPEALAFHADGTADRAAIILRDRDGYGLALRVNPVTARIRIVPLDLDPERP